MIDIKAFRIAKNLTQKEMADYVGVSQTFYSSIENGRRQLPTKRIEILKAKYGAEIDKFLRKSPDETLSELKNQYELQMVDLRQQIANLITTNKVLVETNNVLAMALRKAQSDAHDTGVGAKK